jgi:hypothetical protein
MRLKSTPQPTIMNSRSVAPLLAAIAAVALTTSSTLFARIGETEQECAARYGEPTKTLPNNSLLYEKSDLNIFIIFFNGKADAIAYGKIAKGQQLSESEIELLLKSNSGGAPWQERAVISMNRNWETEDGELLANYNTVAHLLMVATKDYFTRKEATKDAKDLEGF